MSSITFLLIFSLLAVPALWAESASEDEQETIEETPRNSNVRSNPHDSYVRSNPHDSYVRFTPHED